MDFSGGLLSFLQLFIDSISTNNYSGFYGNYVKLLLSVISVLFDIIFIIQHYVLYRKPKSLLIQIDEEFEDKSKKVFFKSP